jgi:tetratricopeptide (TPR) repeat protein
MKRPSKKVIIFAIIIVVVIGVSATAAIIISQQQIAKEQAANDPVLQPPSPAEEKAEEAEKIAFEGDVASGVKTLEEAIKNTTDSHEKYIYYSNLATLLLNDNNLDAALPAAKSAYELEKSSDSAALVGQIARTKGNRAEAVEYYKKAVERLDATDPFSDEDKQYYEETIAEIEGGR